MSAMVPGGARFTSVELSRILAAVAQDMQGHLEELRELDAALGDGDLGITMRLATGVMASAEAQEDVGMWLAQLGMSINKVSPSTFGTLLASAFLGAGSAVRGKSEVDLDDLAAMGVGAVEGVKRRGKSDVGDKTMLDALAPAVGAFRGALADGGGAMAAFAAAAKAAGDGAEATVGMAAKFGRASWRREDSVGLRDAGATALGYMIDSFARHAAA